MVYLRSILRRNQRVVWIGKFLPPAGQIIQIVGQMDVSAETLRKGRRRR